MIVAIEGMDGVGKTTIAKEIAQEFKFTYVKDPLKELFEIDNEHLMKISEKVFSKNSDKLISWFLALGDIYALENYKNEDSVLDRHVLLNYFWNGNKTNEEVFENQVKLFGKPDLTIVLEASVDTRMKRISMRNKNDPDLYKPTMREYGYDKMLKFLEKYKYNYKIIKTDNLELEEVIEQSKQLIEDCMKN